MQELASRLRSLCRFLSNYADRKKEQRRKAKAKPISYFGHASLSQGFGLVDSRGRPNPAAKRQRLDDPVNQEEDRYLCYYGLPPPPLRPLLYILSLSFPSTLHLIV